MDPSTSSAQSQPSADALPQYYTRPEIRGCIFGILLRLLIQRLAQGSPPGAFVSISNPQRRRAFRQSSMLEDVIYRQASCLEEYQDLSTLEERVFMAARAVYANSRRVEMERENRRCIIHNESAAGRRVWQAQAVVRPNGARLRRSESL